MNAKQRIAQAATRLTDALGVPTQNLGMDLDGTVDENPHFFGILSRTWPGNVYVITYRTDRDKAIKDLEALGVRYTELVLVNSFPEKAEVIKTLDIHIYFDDMDEVITHIPAAVTVLKVRNGGNFDEGKWLYSKDTGRQL